MMMKINRRNTRIELFPGSGMHSIFSSCIDDNTWGMAGLNVRRAIVKLSNNGSAHRINMKIIEFLYCNRTVDLYNVYFSWNVK